MRRKGEKEQEHRILIVDAEEESRRLTSELLRSAGYRCETAGSGKEALEKVKDFAPDLIYLDVFLPDIDGYELCRRLKEDERFKDTLIIMISDFTDVESKVKGLKAGATAFLSKPYHPAELIAKTKNFLKIKKHTDFIKKLGSFHEEEMKRKEDKLRESYVDAVHRLLRIMELRDEETAVHIKRVGEFSAFIAEKLGLPSEFGENIRYASPMHDIGKVAIPAEILLKPGNLSKEEFDLVKTHTTVGAYILKGSSSPILQMAEPIALTHHEKWDGSGYPQGLRGEEIPLEGRIVTIADQYDALRSARPHRQRFSHERAVEIITRGDGRTLPEHFDPLVLEVFRKHHKVFQDIYESMK